MFMNDFLKLKNYISSTKGGKAQHILFLKTI